MVPLVNSGVLQIRKYSFSKFERRQGYQNGAPRSASMSILPASLAVVRTAVALLRQHDRPSLRHGRHGQANGVARRPAARSAPRGVLDLPPVQVHADPVVARGVPPSGYARAHHVLQRYPCANQGQRSRVDCCLEAPVVVGQHRHLHGDLAFGMQVQQDQRGQGFLEEVGLLDEAAVRGGVGVLPVARGREGSSQDGHLNEEGEQQGTVRLGRCQQQR